MNYDFTKAIEEVIENCKAFGSARLQRKNERGENTLWLEAEWVEYDDTHDAIELFICYVDTGRTAYSRIIEETITER
jgi:hypothetical protein